jgi:hypothetical protein
MTKRSTYQTDLQRGAGGGIAVVMLMWNGLGKAGATSKCHNMTNSSNARREFHPLPRESV